MSIRWRRIQDRLAGGAMRLAVYLANLLALLLLLGLCFKSYPLLASRSLPDLLGSTSWRPQGGEFGFLPFIVGTLQVSLLAALIAVPICLLAAIHLAEFAARRWRGPLRIALDVLAAIPSVLYGLFGILAVVPAVRELGRLLGYETTGYCLLSGAIVLAMMVTPLITSVATDVLRAVPVEAREACLALGCTRWEATKHVVLRSAFGGIVCAVLLGFSRAFGETLAVLMVVGNVPRLARSVFDPAYPLPALIANSYGEMMSIPLYDSGLMLAALILLLGVCGIQLAAHLALGRLERSA